MTGCLNQVAHGYKRGLIPVEYVRKNISKEFSKGLDVDSIKSIHGLKK